MNKQDFDKMGKEELRKACKAAGVAYGKLNNDGMRAALKAKFAPAKPAAPVVDEKQLNTPQVATLSKVDPKPAPAAPAAAPKRTSTGVKIEKGREEQNGVKRPSTGTICRDVWDALDKLRAKSNETPSFEDVRTLREKNGWQKNTAVTQYQRWKQFHGLMPRANADE